MESNSGYCYICGCELVFDAKKENCELTEDIGEYGYVKEMTCPECGTVYRVWLLGEEESESYCPSISDQGFGNCIHCGGTLMWSGDFMRSDFEEGLSDDDDSIVRSLTCAHCGSPVEVTEPSQNEIKDSKYDFWKEKK